MSIDDITDKILDFNNSSSSNTLSSLSTGNTRIPPQQRKLSHLVSNSPSSKLYQKSFEDDNVTNNTSDINNKHKNLNKPTNDELTTRIKSIQQLADRTIDSILKGLPLERSFGYLNYEFTKLCRYKHVEQSKLSDLIFEKIINDFKTNLKPSIIEILHDNYQDTDSIIQLVKNFLNLFTNWYFRMSDLSKVFIYLDNHYLVQHRTKHPIMLFAIDLFINEVFVEDKQLAKKVLNTEFQLLCKWREQIEIEMEIDDDDDEENDLINMDVIDQSLLFTTVLVDLHNQGFKFDFNEQLLSSIITHYNHLKISWLKNDATTYLSKVLGTINENLRFFKAVGKNINFIKNLFKKLRWNLIFYDFNNLLPKVLPSLLKNEQELGIIYQYCCHSVEDFGYDSILIFIYQWGVYTKSVFESIVDVYDKSTKSSNNNVIEQVVNKYKELISLIITSLPDNDKFEFEVRNSLIKTINNTTSINSMIIYQLCKYCDNFFKGKSSSLLFPDFEKNVLIIFKSINNKQDFINFYKKDLSKRLLLLNQKFKFENEQKFINSLIKVVGENDDVLSLTVMFKDLTDSKDIYKSLITVPTANYTLLNNSFEFNPLILEKKQWPNIPNNEDLHEFKLPVVLQDILTEMTNQYQTLDVKYKNRQLDWTNYKLHQITMSAQFDQGEKEITGNLLQIVLLLLFTAEDDNGYTIEQLSSMTGINNTQFLTKIVNSITNDKYAILRYDGNRYYYNSSFKDKSTRIKLPMIKELSRSEQQQQQQQEKQVKGMNDIDLVESTVQANRDDEIKSCVVKIMKQERQLTIIELLNKSISVLQNRRPVTMTNLKTIIENLIELEYLKRDDHNKNIIIYIP